MYPNYLGLVSALIALAAFALAHRRLRPLPPARRLRVLAWLSALALPAVINAFHYLRLLPQTTAFYEVRSWTGTELLVIPAGLAGGALAALLPRAWLIAPLLGAVFVTWGPFLKPIVGPLRSAEFRDQWTRDVCIQSTLSTCGPASAATVLRKLGVERREQEIARAVHSYLGGTEAWYLARYLRRQGVEARFATRPAGFPEGVRLPAILGVTVDGRGHFIAVLEKSGDRYQLGDPMVGPEVVTRAALEGRYGFTGFALEVSLNQNR